MLPRKVQVKLRGRILFAFVGRFVLWPGLLLGLLLGLLPGLLIATPIGIASNINPPDGTPPLPSPFFDQKSYAQTIDKGRGQCAEENCRWWYDYVKAKLALPQDPKTACELYTGLSETSVFPLAIVALARRADACSYDPLLSAATLAKIKNAQKKSDLKQWVQLALAESGLQASLAAAGAATTAGGVLNTGPGSAAMSKNVLAGSPEVAPDIYTFALQASKLEKTKKLRMGPLQKALAFNAGSGSGDNSNSGANTAVAALRSQVSDELIRIAPHLKTIDEKKPDSDDLEAAGSDELSLHDYDGAAHDFEKVIGSRATPVAEKRKAFENLKASYKALQRKEDAFKITRRYYFWELSLLRSGHSTPDEAKHVLSSGISYAKFLWTEHKSRPALKFLAKLEHILVKSKVPLNLSELYFVRARINEELRNTDKAMAWMKKAQDGADTNSKAQYGWTTAWISYKEGRYLDAQKTMEDLQSTETDPGRKSQEEFWLAKTEQKLKQTDDSRVWLEKVIQEDPLSYYALLAYRELNRPIPRSLESDFEINSKVPRRGLYAPKTLSSVFQWLVAVGEIRWAQQMLDEEYPLPDPSIDVDDSILHAYTQAVYFAPLFSRIAKIPPAEKEKLLSQHSEYLFPRLYRSAVEEASVRSGMWPSYIFSIMRQESSFDPLSISGANAYGLLQLLPNVAASLAKKAGVPYSTPEDLLDPTINIMLGAQHLRNYWEQFDGQFILSTAAYNASPNSVKSWVKSRFRGDPLMFIEDIPYEETRLYVKLVLRNFINYLRIGSSGPSIMFPEWCLDGIHPTK